MIQTQSIKLFYGYAHEDESYRGELEKHLAVLKKRGVIEEWYDRKLIAGEDLDSEILQKIEESDIILFLISSDFLNSEYCYDKELEKALELQEEGKATLIAIVIRPVDWKGAPFENFVMLPTDAKPVTTWSNRDEAWTDVAKGIRLVCEKLLQDFDMQDPEGAKKDEGLYKGNDDEIPFGTKRTYAIQAPQDNPLLLFAARINFSQEAGSAWIMKIIVNGEVLRDQHLLNKPLVKEYKSGRVRPWFSDQNESWFLCYSPNFKDNYFHPRYRVVNGDPYIFAFDLSEIEPKDDKYEVIIEHTGQEEFDAHKNPIVVKGLAIL